MGKEQNVDDRELVSRMIAGDSAAVEYFYSKFRPRFMLIALKAGIAYPDNEDVAQNALLGALRQMPRFRWEASL